MPGAFVGGSFYTGDSNQGDGLPIWTTLFEFHGEYRDHGVQIRAIYAHTSNTFSMTPALNLNAAGDIGFGSSGSVPNSACAMVFFSWQALLMWVRSSELFSRSITRRPLRWILSS